VFLIEAGHVACASGKLTFCPHECIEIMRDMAFGISEQGRMRLEAAICIIVTERRTGINQSVPDDYCFARPHGLS